MDRGKTLDAFIGAKVQAQRIFTYISQDDLAAAVGIEVGDLACYQAVVPDTPSGRLVEMQDLFTRLNPNLQDEALVFTRALAQRGSPADKEPQP